MENVSLSNARIFDQGRQYINEGKIGNINRLTYGGGPFGETPEFIKGSGDTSKAMDEFTALTNQFLREKGVGGEQKDGTFNATQMEAANLNGNQQNIARSKRDTVRKFLDRFVYILLEMGKKMGTISQSDIDYVVEVPDVEG